MSFANNLNKGTKFEFRIPETHKYKKLSELLNENGEGFVYGLKAVYINTKSKYGESPVLVTENELVNVPKHLLDVCNTIRTETEYIKVVNEGKLGFKIYSYQKDTHTYYSIEWVDL